MSLGADGRVAEDGLPSWAIGPFTRPLEAPVLRPRRESTFRCPVQGCDVRWEELHTFNPAAAVVDGRVALLYRAEDASGEMKVGGHTSRIGLALSEDGLTFERSKAPVLFPDHDEQRKNEWPGGLEDPRLVAAEDGRYVCTYTQYNRKVARLAVAVSRDLRQWVKHGPVFGGRFRKAWSKSGSIVSRLTGDRLVATKIDGKYWMYWGEGFVSLATSKDLIRWDPVLDEQGQPIRVLEARKGLFDSGFPEGGPAALLTRDGIVVLYNGKNANDATRDPSLGPGAYSGGQALFSASDPRRLLDRLDQPYLRPELPFERTGQYVEGTTFAEGLVCFKGRWLLYYGCADSFIGVAEAKFR